MVRSPAGKLPGMGRAGSFALGLAMMIVVLFGFQAATKPAHAASTFTVNQTGDLKDPGLNGVCDANPFAGGPQCTLRAAIQEANATTGADTIRFNIPSSDSNCNATTHVCTISPTSALPTITEQVTINGYTQSGASPNTLAKATNALLKIELDGSNAGGVHGLTIEAPNTVVRGLVINDFNNVSAGIAVRFSATGARVEGNFLGTNAGGTQPRGNFYGVLVFDSSGNTIGGPTPDKRNLISGNTSRGIRILGSTNNNVEGNLIGTKKDATTALGNSSSGVNIDGISPNNLIGDDNPSDDPSNGAPNAANVIAFNGGDGVRVISESDTSNSILGNSIFSNGQLGIDLGDDGVTPNDDKDPDAGPNRLQNYPFFTSVAISGGNTTVEGRLNSRPNRTFTIQFYSSRQADSSGFGEGKTFLGQSEVTTNDLGRAAFSFTKALPAGEDVVSATATNTATGDTSEFSKVVISP